MKMQPASKLLAAVLIAAGTFAPLAADKTVTKTVTVNRLLYADKTIEELKAICVDKAKYEAAKEIFGEMLLSETVMANGKIVDEFVRERSGGVIHVKGEPAFANGKNLGDIQCTVTAYATDKDIRDTTPQTIRLENFKYTNPDVPLKKLKAMAEDAFIIEALAKKKPDIRYASPAQARRVAAGVKIDKMDFDVDTFTYTISGSVEYIPAFLQHADLIQTTEIADRFKQRSHAPKPAKKRGYYGDWSGYVMRPDGSSGAVQITIADNGQATASFPDDGCGGDLIVQEKTPRKAEFTLALTYGQESCEDNLNIVLVRKSDEELGYRATTQKGEDAGRASLYRDDFADD